MKYCPMCGIDYDLPGLVCPKYGHGLVRLEKDELYGTVVDGQYCIEGVLGRGGMGVVYMARQEMVDRRIALKLLRRDLASNENSRKRFLTEARAIARLTSEHTVTLLGYGETDNGVPYLAMELLRGQSLARKIHAEGRLHWTTALEYLVQISQSLSEAHRKGILHRDLKPDNVFISWDAGERECIKILDFGIARFQEDLERLTHTGVVCGTAEYASPEQLFGEPMDQRSDLYSLGVVAYEMLSGQPPFHDEPPVKIANNHWSSPPPSLAQGDSVEPLPTAVEEAVLRLLAKKPADRPADAAACEDLFRQLQGKSVSESVSTPMRPREGVSVRPATVRRSQWSSLTAAASVGLLALAFLWVTASRYPTPGDRRGPIRPTAPQQFSVNTVSARSPDSKGSNNEGAFQVHVPDGWDKALDSVGTVVHQIGDELRSGLDGVRTELTVTPLELAAASSSHLRIAEEPPYYAVPGGMQTTPSANDPGRGRKNWRKVRKSIAARGAVQVYGRQAPHKPGTNRRQRFRFPAEVSAQFIKCPIEAKRRILEDCSVPEQDRRCFRESVRHHWKAVNRMGFRWFERPRIRLHCRGWVVLLLFISLPLAAQERPAPDVSELNDQAIELSGQGAYEEAIEIWLGLLARTGDPGPYSAVLHRNIGRNYQKMGSPEHAWYHYSLASSVEDDSGLLKTWMGEVERELEQAGKHPLRVQAREGTRLVMKDGEKLRSYPCPLTWWWATGNATVVVERPSGSIEQETVAVTPGRSEWLMDSSEPVPEPELPLEEPTSAVGTGPRWWHWGILGSGLAVAAAGGIVLGIASSNLSDLRGDFLSDSTLVEPERSAVWEEQMDSRVIPYERSGWVLMSLGTVTALGTGAWMVWDCLKHRGDSSTGTSSSNSAVPLVAPGLLGVTVTY